MVKIKKLLLYGILFLAILQITLAADVGYVIQFPDGSLETGCMEASTGTNGYNLFEATGLSFLWAYDSILGHDLCRINGIGDDVSGSFCAFSGSQWNINMLVNSSWQPMSSVYDGQGACWTYESQSGARYCAADGDVLGLTYNGGSVVPEIYEFQELCPKLQVTQLKAYVNGDKKSSVDETGGTLRNVEPGSSLKLVIEVTNRYTDNQDVEIEDIEISVVIDGIDDGDDLEQESADFDLDAEDDKKISFFFDIPFNANEDEYDIEITIEGEDDNGWEYDQTIEIELEVDRDNHYVVLTEASLYPTSVSCTRTAKIDVDLINAGNNDEDITLSIKSQGLGLDITDSFELSKNPDHSDNDISESYSFNIPSSVPAGTYPIIVAVSYWKETEKETLDLKVRSCGTVNQNSILIIQNQQVSAPRQQSSTKQTLDGSFFLILLWYSIVIIIGFVVFWFIKT